MSHPKEIELPEDDPASMEIVCNITHLRSRCVTLKPSAHMLLDLAILIDKYDLLSCCFLAVEVWLARVEEDPYGVMLRVQASFLFGAREAFRRFTKEVIENYGWSVGDLYKELHPASRLPIQVLCK